MTTRRGFLATLGALLGLPAVAKAVETPAPTLPVTLGYQGFTPNRYSQHGVVTSGYSRVTDLDTTWTPSKAYYVEGDRIVYNGASYRIPPAPYILPRRD